MANGKQGRETAEKIRKLQKRCGRSLLEKRTTRGSEEVEDMLGDLEFSIEEIKCICHRECSSS
ncbi:hypothetical protein GTO27_09225 [Candidatus Bathyarchaeota archaeon]|nr:hypothetical protein [Candidatus Bathyarchaeota archaeon]